MSEKAEDVDYQLGAHKIDTSGSIVDDDNVIEFDFESGAVFQRLADDIYESPEAGIREPLTNAITTVRRVFDNSSDGVIKITVQDGDQVMLRLRDNGEGITKGVLNEVLTVIGRSNARDDGELSGQYGMGFLASYKLVGLDGGFLMCTNPRDTDDGPYSGLFKPGTFEPDNDNSLPTLLDDDEYGTVFEYYIRDDISIEDIRSWVDRNARWSPVPIIYKELDSDGNVEYNEDYYASNLSDMYGDAPYLSVENEYYEAATSPDSKNDIVLISSPVDMKGTRSLRRSLPWQVDLRLKHENGVIFKGPNKGMVPVKEKEYSDMDEERRSNYVRESDMEADDMHLPEPTGTREQMRRHRDFLKHVNAQLKEKYLDQVEDTLDSFNPDTMSLRDLDEMGRHILLRIFNEFEDDDEYSKDDIKSKLSSSYDYDTDDTKLLEFIQTMTDNIPVVSAGTTYGRRYPRKPAYKLQEANGRVFMCISKNTWKAEAVDEADEETHLVSLESADQYELFEEHLGWEKLKSIKKSNATELLDITKDEIDNIRGGSDSKAQDITERTVTLHVKSGGRATRKKDVSTVVDYYNNYKSRGSQYGDVLVLFSRQGEENVSDHYTLADSRCSVASCGKKIHEYLVEESENIVPYEEYKEWVLSDTIKTSNGTMFLSDLLESNRDKVLYVGDTDSESVLDSIQIMDIISEGLDDYENPIFGLIEKKKWVHIDNLDMNLDTVTLIRNGNLDTTHHNYSTDTFDLVDLFMHSYVPDPVHNRSEFISVRDSHNQLDKNVIIDCKWLKELHQDQNAEFASQEEDQTQSVALPKHTTADGKMTITEIYDNYRPKNVVIHSLSAEKYDYFVSDDILENASKAVSGREVGTYSIPHVGSPSIYVPVLETEYNKIEEFVNNESIVLGEWDLESNRTMDISAKYVYALVKLSNRDGENIKNLIKSHGIDSAVHIIESFQQVSDSLPTYTDDLDEIKSQI